MGLRNLVLIALVALAGVGLASMWNAAAGAASRSGSTAEGFKEDTTDEDIDFFVAVSGAMKRNSGAEPTASEVRRTVAEMRKKRVSIKDVDTFVRTRGGRVAIEKPSPDPAEGDGGGAPPDIKKADASPDPSKGDGEKSGKVAARKAKKSESERRPPALSASVADRLTKELNEIADRVDDLVEEIAKYSQQPMDQPIQASVSEGFANFSSW